MAITLGTGALELGHIPMMKGRPDASSDWCELNHDVVRQKITHIQNAIDKNVREDLTVMVSGEHGILSAIEICRLNPVP
jgi:hypothetical protein